MKRATRIARRAIGWCIVASGGVATLAQLTYGH